MLSILDSMINLTDERHRESDHELGLLLYQSLKNRRYLIILDDIWDTDAWDSVKWMFPDDNNGSQIILTTRLSDLATYASPSGPLHQISLLSDDLSWILLRAKVFGEEPCPLNLQDLGMKIAKKCRGLPLSIVVVGGLLSRLNITQEAWQDIAENIVSFVNSSDDQCLEILRLSYNYLPQRLKACFLHLGAFQEDHEISVSKITKLWLGECFLKQDQFQGLEEGAERCLEELAERSLILVSKQNFDGKIRRFRIHDLLRKLCVNEANNERFLQVINSDVNIYAGKHYLRSSEFFPRFKLLKVLDAIQVEFLKFPFEILELLNLSYVAFMYHGEIPASISKFQSLQTLIIHQEVFLSPTQKYHINLPVEIWEIPHLRHVEFTNAYLLDPIGAPLDTDGKPLVLKELQSLSGIKNLRFTEDMLKRITNIKKLDISYDDGCCWREKGWSYYHLDNLFNLHQLEALKITVIPDAITFIAGLIPHLKFAAFPPTLKKLTLSGCEIPWDDLAVVSSLPNLEVLKLKDEACVGTVWEPNESSFCNLKLLVLEGLYLKHWNADHYQFPFLEHLIFRHCVDLVEIPDGMGESSTLSMIKLDNLNVSLLTSMHNIKEIQQSFGSRFVVHQECTMENGMMQQQQQQFLKSMSELGFRIIKGGAMSPSNLKQKFRKVDLGPYNLPIEEFSTVLNKIAPIPSLILLDNLSGLLSLFIPGDQLSHRERERTRQ